MKSVQIALGTLAAAVALGASAQNVCPDIAKTLKEYSIDSSSSSYLNSVFTQHCQSDGSRKSSGGGVGLEAVIKAVPTKFSGNYNSAEEGFTNFCKTYKSFNEGSAAADAYKETISRKALETIQQCVALQATGVLVSHQISNVEGANFYVRGSATSKLDLNGVAITGNVACEGQVGGRKKTFDSSLNIKVDASTVQFACKRTGTKNPNNTMSYGEATVTVLTSQGNYALFWPMDERQSQDMATAIDRRISFLEADLGVAKGGLAPFVAATPVKLYKCPFGAVKAVNAAWASYGCNGQVTTEGRCVNTWYNVEPETRECAPIGTARLIQ